MDKPSHSSNEGPANSAESAAESSDAHPRNAVPNSRKASDTSKSDSDAIVVEAVEASTNKPVFLSYNKAKVVGSGSFGTVFSAILNNTERVAIKKVLQDKRFKNRELQILRLLKHPNVVILLYYFYSICPSKPGDTYLSLVQEFIPETLGRVVKQYWKMRQSIPLAYVKLYSFQLLRGLAYVHDNGVCHRDIKPQNILVDPDQGLLKICDFGSAKILNPTEPNVSYICSRYYRAPELIFGAMNYTFSIDMWSAGCVIGELLLGRPLFAGDSGVDQLVEIIKVLGTPSQDDVLHMNPNYSEFQFPRVDGVAFERLMKHRAAHTAAFDLLRALLVYAPNARMTAPEAMGAVLFMDLLASPRGHPPTAPIHLPSGRTLPPFMSTFSQREMGYLPADLVERIHEYHEYAETFSKENEANDQATINSRPSDTEFRASSIGGSSARSDLSKNRSTGPHSGPRTVTSNALPSEVASETSSIKKKSQAFREKVSSYARRHQNKSTAQTVGSNVSTGPPNTEASDASVAPESYGTTDAPPQSQSNNQNSTETPPCTANALTPDYSNSPVTTDTHPAHASTQLNRRRLSSNDCVNQPAPAGSPEQSRKPSSSQLRRRGSLCMRPLNAKNVRKSSFVGCELSASVDGNLATIRPNTSARPTTSSGLV